MKTIKTTAPLCCMTARIAEHSYARMGELAKQWNVSIGRIHSIAIEYAINQQLDLFKNYLNNLPRLLSSTCWGVDRIIAACKTPKENYTKTKEIADQYNSKIGRIQALAVEFSIMEYAEQFDEFLEKNKQRLSPYNFD